MCGFGGYFSVEGVRQDVLAEMSALLKHRGPDDEGYLFIDSTGKAKQFSGNDTVAELRNLPHINGTQESTNACFGMLHRRLSILDLSHHGHQPMSDESGNYIALNGEIYNYVELKDELRAKGYSFASESDTEVVLKAYHCWGTDCFRHFRGMWALAIWDYQKQELILSRDRFAIKPLYLTSGAVFAFASEPKALLAVSGIQARLNQTALFEYLSYGGLSDTEGSLFQDINELPPGYWIRVNKTGRVQEKKSFYDLSREVSNTQVPDTFIAQLNRYSTLFSESIALHLRSDVPIGSCLSGGLDSSAVVAIMSLQQPYIPLATFTAAYKDSSLDESHFAKMVTEHLANATAAYTFPDGEGLWNEYRNLIWHQDLPVHSTSMYAQWEVMKLAGNSGVKVLLDGQGADESLGGYDNYLGAYLLQHLQHFRWSTFFREARLLKENRLLKVRNSLGRAAFHQLPAFAQHSIRKRLRLGQSFLNENFISSIPKSPAPEMFGGNLKEVQSIGIFRGLRELLRYEDRNSMAFSIESRVPFLDHKLMEYTLALPPESLTKKGYSKYILRKAVQSHLPEGIVWRKDKKGFVTPQEQWQSNSKVALMDFLENIDFPPQINRQKIIQLASTELRSGTPSNEFWKLIAILVWKDVFKVQC